MNSLTAFTAGVLVGALAAVMLVAAHAQNKQKEKDQKLALRQLRFRAANRLSLN